MRWKGRRAGEEERNQRLLLPDPFLVWLQGGPVAPSTFPSELNSSLKLVMGKQMEGNRSRNFQLPGAAQETPQAAGVRKMRQRGAQTRSQQPGCFIQTASALGWAGAHTHTPHTTRIRKLQVFCLEAAWVVLSMWYLGILYCLRR